MRALAFLIFVIVLLPTPLTAQTPLPTAGEAMGGTDGETNTAAVTEYEFEADNVEGGIIRPLGDTIRGEGHRKTPSLIQVRANFVDELVASVSDI